MKAYALLEQLRASSTARPFVTSSMRREEDLGYGLLLKRYTRTSPTRRQAQDQMATKDSIPRMAPLLAFRIMVGCGIVMLLIIAASFWSVIRNRIGEKNGCCVRRYAIPLPWIAIESGWFVAGMDVSHGRLVSAANGSGQLLADSKAI